MLEGYSAWTRHSGWTKERLIGQRQRAAQFMFPAFATVAVEGNGTAADDGADIEYGRLNFMDHVDVLQAIAASSSASSSLALVLETDAVLDSLLPAAARVGGGERAGQLHCCVLVGLPQPSHGPRAAASRTVPAHLSAVLAAHVRWHHHVVLCASAPAHSAAATIHPQPLHVGLSGIRLIRLPAPIRFAIGDATAD